MSEEDLRAAYKSATGEDPLVSGRLEAGKIGEHWYVWSKGPTVGMLRLSSKEECKELVNLLTLLEARL
jgi:hypothetical protein